MTAHCTDNTNILHSVIFGTKEIHANVTINYISKDQFPFPLLKDKIPLKDKLPLHIFPLFQE